MSLLGGRRQTILIHSGRADPAGRKIEADVTGLYAIHPQVTFRTPAGETGWAVTHVASGYLVWKVRERAEALAVSAWLEENSPLPPDLQADALLTWIEARRKLSTELGNTLHAIAPRWDGNTGKYTRDQ